MNRHKNNALDIKMEMTFDNEERSFYFGGDTIQGKVFITCNQSNYNLSSSFRFAWTGSIQVHPIETNKESRVLFNQLFKLSNKFYKTIAKTEKGSLPLYVTEFIPDEEKQGQIEQVIALQKKKTIALTFNVKVPNDRILPSSTETSHSPNKIIYLLEAFIDENSNQRPRFFCQRLAPIYEKIYTQPLMKEQKTEQSYYINQHHKGALRVTLPCLGCQAGVTIPVSVSIWNQQEIRRKQGIVVSLIRINHVYANNRVYISQPEKIHRVVTDLNLVSKDAMSVQMIYIGLPIPKNILPTITLESSQLMAVSYFVRVQVYAQQGVYQPIGKQGNSLEFMMADLPFTIGTIANNTSLSPPLSPVVAKSVTEFSFSSLSTNNEEEEQQKKKKKSKLTRHLLKAGIFRKSSTSSSFEKEEEETNDQKTNSSVTFELYEQQLTVADEQKKNYDTNHKDTQIEQLAVKSANTKPDDNGSNQDDITNSNGMMFNMFYDEDSDDEINASTKNSSSATKDLQQSTSYFQMFPDSDSDE